MERAPDCIRGMDANRCYFCYCQVVGNELQKIHDKYNEINQGNYIDTILNEGADKARYMARKKLAKVERKIGITIKK